MAEDEMLRVHQENWHGFVRMSTIGTAVVAGVLVLMALFLL